MGTDVTIVYSLDRKVGQTDDTSILVSEIPPLSSTLDRDTMETNYFFHSCRNFHVPSHLFLVLHNLSKPISNHILGRVQRGSVVSRPSNSCVCLYYVSNPNPSSYQGYLNLVLITCRTTRKNSGITD